VATVAEGRAVTTGQFDGHHLTVPDLRVGEIRALRTFRVGLGRLHPVTYDQAGPWQSGMNTARCAHGHTPAAPGCMCGFWAYGTYRAARRYAEARRVLAVVACWGRVVPGTHGLRAQHARIEAIWLSARIPRPLVKLLRIHYPSVTFYRSKRLMLIRHPPTRLDSYRPEPRRRRRWNTSRTRERFWAFMDPNDVFVVLGVVLILLFTQVLLYVL
jgi:hypothetical protein